MNGKIGMAACAAWALCGCLGGGSEVAGGKDLDDPRLEVHVVDSTGAPFAADTVTWAYVAALPAAKPAHGSDTATRGARRLNPEGTRWHVQDPELHGTVYVRARREIRDPADSLCLLWADAEVRTHADSAFVLLELRPRRLCQ